ncbi:uncharacterized protein LOC131669655 isoform X2 [Phymastichus coffea]|uniref:uncharacterized protein LOC131669655 isoform X2 n=1 Tax=Phymastichus coffea TaxID=108790 RepID=UPI00273A7AE5|nr:uncharacterized protein LOC131669655 isoform X2 [Phymastichus coffea]
MARSSLIAATTFCLLLQFGFASLSQYTDDSDYDFNYYYKDLPEKQGAGRAEDDFYIANESEEERSRRLMVETQSDQETDPSRWPPQERVYRYTKHRIPGYDYDELQLRQERCDDRSVWTHCLCQFTCARPNVVDCYTPCDSGCECRENYVFDERARMCVRPEECQPDADYLLY